MTRPDPSGSEPAGDRDALVVEIARHAAARLGARVIAAVLDGPRVGRPLVVVASGGDAAIRPDLALPAQALLARFRRAAPGWVRELSRIPPEFEVPEGQAVAVAALPDDATVRGAVVVVGAEPSEDALQRLGEVAAGLSLAVAAAHAVEGGRSVSEAGALQAMTDVLADSAQMGKVLSVAARTGARATGFGRCTVLLRGTAQGLAPAASESDDGPAPLAGWRVFADGLGMPAANESMATGRPALYNDPAAAPDLRPAEWVVPNRIRRVLIAPLVAWDEPLGVMVFDDDRPGPTPARDLRIARGIASQAAVGVKVSQVVDGLRQSRRHAQLVLGTMAHAAAQFNTEGVLEVIADAAHEVLGDAATVVVATRRGELGPAAVHGNEVQGREVLARLAAGAALGDRCDGVSAVYGDDLSRFPELPADEVGRALVAPLRRASQELGWLVSFGPSPRRYREADLRIVAGLATQAALSLHTVGVLEGERSSVNRLEALGKQKTGFVASVSHELRTPLTAIIGFSEILAEWLEEERLRSFVDDVRREAVVLEGIIGNLLDTSRLEAGVLHIDRVPLDVAGLVAECVDVVQHSYPAREFRVEMAPVLPPVSGDAVRVRQILVNLLENAAKYSPDGTAVALRVANGDGWLSLEVVDEGPGIPGQYRSQVFERFFRLEGVHGKPGTGIGLYLVRELTEAHGGTVRIGDGPGGLGCAVEVRLPLEAAAQSAPA